MLVNHELEKSHSVYQEYDYSTDKLKGYNVTTTLSVKDLGIEQAGEVITEAIRAGANTSNGIRFTCSEYDQAYEEALGNAVEAAEYDMAAIMPGESEIQSMVTVTFYLQ